VAAAAPPERARARSLLALAHFGSASLGVLLTWLAHPAVARVDGLSASLVGCQTNPLLAVCAIASWRQHIRRAVFRRTLLLTLENMNQGIVMVDADGRIQFIN